LGVMGETKQKKVDKSLDMTFPASDPPASRRATSTEAPARPASRQAPVLSKEQVEAAAGGDPATRRQKALKGGHAVGREGADQASPRRRRGEEA
jgi:hypothetical protein